MLRGADLFLAALGLALAWPLILFLALLIRLESPGAPIFSQKRVGRGGSIFTCYKLRTMRSGTTQGASHEVGAAGITRFGRLLRRTKLDELPQLWNVLVGEMSFVGPRPCLPVQRELIDARERLGVYALRPGITGPAQIRGLDMSEPLQLAAADAAWLREQSLGAYLRIMAATLFGAGSGDAAVRPD